MSRKNDVLGPLPRALVGLSEKRLGLILDLANRLGSKDGERWEERIEKLLQRGLVEASIAEDLKERLRLAMKNSGPYTRLISGDQVLILDPTDGTETIANVTETSTVKINSTFRNCGGDGMGSQPTIKTRIQVHEIIKDGNCVQIFGDLSDNLDSLCLGRGQIIQCVNKYRQWLRNAGDTLFLLKEGSEFLVAHVSMLVSSLWIGSSSFSDDFVWKADEQHRVVFPFIPQPV